MDLEALHTLLNETTVQLRKRTVTERDGHATHFYLMPHVDEAADGLEIVDLEFIAVGVDKAKADPRRDDLIRLLDTYPALDRLAGGPSYIEVGAVIGDQGAAFQLFALGKVLGLWSVITPATIGATGDQARQMAGMGFIMISGYRPDQVEAA
jgi:hypothetical protein